MTSYPTVHSRPRLIGYQVHGCPEAVKLIDEQGPTKQDTQYIHDITKVWNS